MYSYPKTLEDLIASFSLLPGVGKKTAERYAFSVVNSFRAEEIEELISNLENIKKLHSCPSCGSLTDEDLCSICRDDTRNWCN